MKILSKCLFSFCGRSDPMVEVEISSDIVKKLQPFCAILFALPSVHPQTSSIIQPIVEYLKAIAEKDNKIDLENDCFGTSLEVIVLCESVACAFRRSAFCSSAPCTSSLLYYALFKDSKNNAGPMIVEELTVDRYTEYKSQASKKRVTSLQLVRQPKPQPNPWYNKDFMQ